MDSKDKSCSSGCCGIIGIIPWRLKGNVKGRMEKPKSEKGTEIRQINEWFKLGGMIDINTPHPFSAFLARWMAIHERNE